MLLFAIMLMDIENAFPLRTGNLTAFPQGGTYAGKSFRPLVAHGNDSTGKHSIVRTFTLAVDDVTLAEMRAAAANFPLRGKEIYGVNCTLGQEEKPNRDYSFQCKQDCEAIMPSHLLRALLHGMYWWNWDEARVHWHPEENRLVVIMYFWHSRNWDSSHACRYGSEKTSEVADQLETALAEVLKESRHP